jgi:heme/copper-type cytochrome/quinol oxidase subunit 2
MSPQEKHPNDPNRGLNTKVFMSAVLIAIVIIIVSIYFVLAARGTKDVPKVDRPNPNSSLQITQPWRLS